MFHRYMPALCSYRRLSLGTVGLVGLLAFTAHAQTGQYGMAVPRPAGNTLSPCKARPKIVKLDHLSCFDTGYGWAFVEPSYLPGDAAFAIVTLQTAAHRFEQAFGKSVPFGAIVLYRDSLKDLSEVQQDLKSAGAQWVRGTPMPDSLAVEAKRDQWEQRRSEEIKKVHPNIPEARLNDTVATLWALSRQFQLHDYTTEFGHESGHAWGALAYPSKPGDPPLAAYNWMDEAFAILGDGLYKTRWYFTILLNMREDSTQSHYVKPLATFFSATQHPVNVQPLDGDAILAFYAETSAVVHFLMERTHKLDVLGAIAAHGANNLDNVTEFLRDDGARYGLPSTMEGLEKEWQVWLGRLAVDYARSSPHFP